MTAEQFAGKLCEYLGGPMSKKAKGKMTQFAFGFTSQGVGRKIIESKVVAMAPYFTGPDGNVDVEGLKASVESGFQSAGSLPVLGGIVSFDAGDAKGFFDFLEPVAPSE